MVRGCCAVGSTVELKDVGRDKYFRIDATPICGGVDVAAELVKAGLPMGMPAALALAQRAMTQPSLLESTTTGRLARDGANAFSHEA